MSDIDIEKRKVVSFFGVGIVMMMMMMCWECQEILLIDDVLREILIDFWGWRDFF